MNTTEYYEVHAFAEDGLGGNPAGVCPLDSWLTDAQMRFIAASNNLSETAFFVPEKDGYAIRFFAPNCEVDLCGHATLASAWVLFHQKQVHTDEIIFYCKGGKLTVSKSKAGLRMSLPALPYHEITLGKKLLSAFSIPPKETWLSTYDVLCVYESQQQVEEIQLNLAALQDFPYRGMILTAPGKQTDIYSRCFYPQCDVFEDPVTGSAHAVLAVYWRYQLNQKVLTAEQGYNRRGRLQCEVLEDRVMIDGKCYLYLKGMLCLWYHI